jgi:hypothetical protein
MPSVSGLSAPHRILARTGAVNAAHLGLKNAAALHYTEGPRRWDGIHLHKDARKGEFPQYADCSAFVTWCLWNGLYLEFGVRDTVNGAHWLEGYTGSMLDHGKEVVHEANFQRADYVIYGSGAPGKHTALIVGRALGLSNVKDGVPMVISNGSEAGPFFLPWNYRSDIMQVRRGI